jgi:hypothetical protein
MEKITKINRMYLLLFSLFIVFNLLTGCNGITLTPTIPEIDFFSADAPFLIEGNTTNLSWAVSNADTVTIDQGIGEVDLSGSHVVSPTEKTTYTLTATSGTESETAEVTINVMPSYWEPPDWWDDITIQPSEQTIVIQPGPEEGKDSFIHSAFPNKNFGDETYGMIGKVDDFSVRTYLQFDLSSLSSDSVIVSADLKLYQYAGTDTENFNIGVYSISDLWGEDGITWATQPNYDFTPEITISVSPVNNIWLSWNIRYLVQAWVEGDINNLGVLLKKTNEKTGNEWINYWTSEYAFDPDLRPKLEITYYAPTP